MKAALIVCLSCLSSLAWVAGAEPTIAERNVRKADTRGVIPRLAAAPTVDGTIKSDEWQDALVYNGVLYEKTLNLFPRNVEWRFGWTDNGFHIASHTIRMQGETPKAQTKDGKISNLVRDDSFELLVYDAGRRSSLRLVVNPAGTWAVDRRVNGKSETGDAGVRAAASLTDKALAYEAFIPFTALGRAQPGRQWRLLPVRNFRIGTNISAPLPYAHRGNFGRQGRTPVFTLAEKLPVVQLQPLQQALYAGRPLARLQLVNPADQAQEVTVNLKIHRGNDIIGKAARKVPLPPGERLPVTVAVNCDPAIDPEVEDEYRYDLDVVGPGNVELLHTHFTWNPTEHRGWLGNKLPGRRQTELRVVTIDPRAPVPLPYQRFMKQYKDLPADHRLEIATRRTVVPGKGYVVDSVQHITPVDAKGRKDGVQTLYRLGYILEHSITWKRGVRHGPEKFFSHARNQRGRSFNYLQKVVPWVDGVIRGVRRVYHPNGELLAQTTYENGRAVGVSRRYNEHGRLVRTTPCKNGLPHGIAVDYYACRPRRVIPVRDGKVEGVVIDYNWPGRIIKKTRYKGKLDLGLIPFAAGKEPEGISRSFNEDGSRAEWRDADGNVVQTVEYRKGVPDGRCTLYFPRRIKRRVPYEKGLINGVVVDYWENGEVKQKRPFRQDVLHGIEERYDQSGKRIRTRKWQDGAPRR